MVVSLSVKKQFFDRAGVIAAVGKARAKNLSKAGAFVRTAARSSLRRRKAISSPGSPPSVHSKSPVATLKNVLFAWDPRSQSVVIGPVGMNAKSVFQGSVQAGVVPRLMEFGGSQGIIERQNRDGSWARADLRSRRRLGGVPMRTRTAQYQPRPFMGPAMNQELPKFPELWRNSVVKAA